MLLSALTWSPTRVLTEESDKQGLARRAGIVLIGFLLLAGCDRIEAETYDVRITNESSAELLAVLANGTDGGSIFPAYRLPADGVTRTNEFAIHIFDMTAGEDKAVILIYSVDCRLIDTVEVSSGLYDIRIRADGAVAVRVTGRPTGQPPLAELQESSVACPGAGPTTASSAR